MGARTAGMDKQLAAEARPMAVAVSTAPVLLLIAAIVTVRAPEPTATNTPAPVPLEPPEQVGWVTVQDAPPSYGPNRVSVQWGYVTGARRYVVQQSVNSAAWRNVVQVIEYENAEARDQRVGGGGIYYAPACTPTQFRVAAFGDGYLRAARLGRFSDESKSFAPSCDKPFVSITGGSSVTEGEAVTFTLNAANPKPDSALTINVKIGQVGNVTNGIGTKNVTMGTSGVATFTVATIDDDVNEADGFVSAAIQAGTGYRIPSASRSATVQVKDNDAPVPTPAPTPDPPPPVVPVVSISGGGAITEGADADFTLTASPKPTTTIDVGVSITQEGDFTTARSETVRIGTGGKATLSIATIDDSLDDPDGSITATVRSGSGYLADNLNRSAKVTVKDNDLPPTPTPIIKYAPLKGSPGFAPRCSGFEYGFASSRTNLVATSIKSYGRRHQARAEIWAIRSITDLNIFCIQARFVSQSKPGAGKITWEGALHQVSKTLNSEDLDVGRIGLMDLVSFLALYEEVVPSRTAKPILVAEEKICNFCQGGTLQASRVLRNGQVDYLEIELKHLKKPILHAYGEHRFQDELSVHLKTAARWETPSAGLSMGCDSPLACFITFTQDVHNELKQDIDTGLAGKILDTVLGWLSEREKERIKR